MMAIALICHSAIACKLYSYSEAYDVEFLRYVLTNLPFGEAKIVAHFQQKAPPNKQHKPSQNMNRGWGKKEKV